MSLELRWAKFRGSVLSPSGPGHHYYYYSTTTIYYYYYYNYYSYNNSVRLIIIAELIYGRVIQYYIPGTFLRASHVQ